MLNLSFLIHVNGKKKYVNRLNNWKDLYVIKIRMGEYTYLEVSRIMFMACIFLFMSFCCYRVTLDVKDATD